MNKSLTASLILGTIILGGVVAYNRHPGTLVEQPHDECAIHSDPVVSTAAPIGGSGTKHYGQISVDAILLKCQSGQVSLGAFLVKS